GSGLRVSEVVNLDKDQYTGKGFSRVQIKGGVIRDFGSCPCRLRINLPGSPVDSHGSKKA
ncbi:MAG TPA: hypothetical protein VFD73_20695, partial [Gemmatimonadales bacterium]|nr:hypothetical protein [Gemmatimonadales bacterium]